MPSAPDLSGVALDDRYELSAIIGEGSFGRVYRGRDRRLHRPVAIKVIKPWWTDDPQWVTAFERETRLLARISDPGVVQIFDVGQAPEGLYYVAELVDGQDLALRLRHGPLTPAQAAVVATQLCRALGRAHERGIVHRDVKPANILLSREGQVKVGDFGVARLAGGSSDGGTAGVVGTPRYMAPEQARGRATTPATDVYSVGVVLYEMLAGRPPFLGAAPVELALRHLREQPPALGAQVPRALREITSRALAKDPARRFADGAEMAQALQAARERIGELHPVWRVRTMAVGRERSATAATAGRERSATGATAGRDRPATGGTAVLTRSEPPATGPPRTGRGRPPASPPRPRDHTLPAPVLGPRRNVNPSARRRAMAALGLVVLLVAGMAGAAVLLGKRTTVPSLTGLRRAAAVARARRRHLVPRVAPRFDRGVAAGWVISQSPRPGLSVGRGSTMSLAVSRGPAPVRVPAVVGDGSSARARQALARAHLHATVTAVAAPDSAPGTVLRADPAAGTSVATGSTVALSVAEVPRWRPVATVSGTAPVRFTIRGRRWRIVYTMAFHGMCTWIVFCSGPHAEVTGPAGSGGFGLDDGGTRVRTLHMGPGTYALRVRPGGDDARWSLQVQDDY
ncbi:MAG: protein kinase [Solirubrobacterales bacterium]|nr:protein kinase [Solirubrobacterales bacterium]